MGWKEEYKSKLRTPEEAVKVIRSGDHIYTGTSSSIAYRLIEALYGRKDELENVVMCHGMMGQQLPIFTPEAKGPDYLYLLPSEPDRILVPGSGPAQRGVPGGVPPGQKGLYELRGLWNLFP